MNADPINRLHAVLPFMEACTDEICARVAHMVQGGA
jgi:hypothetical protein